MPSIPVSHSQYNLFFKRSILILLACFLSWNLSLSGDDSKVKEQIKKPIKKAEKFTPAQLEFFEKTIRPLLIKRCYECHSKEESEGGLQLDSRESIFKGGDSGAAVDFKNHLKSLLLESISYQPDAVVEMPPDGRLTKEEVASITRWVKEGLPWPPSEKMTSSAHLEKKKQEFYSEEKRNFWAFQPVKKPETPKVSHPAWIQNEIDSFVLSQLEKNKMKPARKASKLNLIRRATFDLTGLPPTPKEVEEFLNDQSPKAYHNLIDRLLASPSYGIRWGRHWLDVVRYADSNGMDENMSYGYAFRYRDYVVNSFNSDKPYDLFVKEQIAGDLMPDPANEQITIERQIATGYLAIGAKMLAEDDPVKMRMDIIDEQIDTTGKAIMGMTLGCARCHDHKFDPISTEDYYALAGIFKSTKTMKNYKVVADWFDRPVETKATIAAFNKFVKNRNTLTSKINKIKTDADKNFITEERKKVKEYLLAASRKIASHHQYDDLANRWNKEKDKTENTPGLISIHTDKFDKGNVDVQNQQKKPKVSVILTFKTGVSFAEYHINSPDDQQYAIYLQYAALNRRPLKLFMNGQLVKPESAGKTTGSWGPEGQKWFFEVTTLLKKGKNVLKLECSQLFPHVNQIRLLPTTSGVPIHHANLTNSSLNNLLVEQWIDHLKKSRKDHGTVFRAWNDLQDHIISTYHKSESYNPLLKKRVRQTLVESEENLAEHYSELFINAETAWAALKSVKGSEKITNLPDQELEAYRSVLYNLKGAYKIPAEVETAYPEKTRTELIALRKTLSDVNTKAPAALKMAMGVTENNVENMQICIRGNHINLGKEVPRGFLKIMLENSHPEIKDKQSGRLQLVNWLTNPNHPLTSRVMVNRIWRWHFGEGIVRTPDNFGITGELPTNQPLLDWLSKRFIEEGWSIKKMHKLIMTSSTYQMNTKLNNEYLEKDPENKLLWRMNRKRLEIEAIRDAILSIAGTIDNVMGGTLLKIPNNQYVTGTSSKISVEYQNTRRSIYLPVIRSALFEMFQAFDFPDPSAMQGDRSTTTIAPQALFMLNSKFMDEQTEEMARRLIKEMPESTEDRVNRAYQLVYGRKPTETELGDMQSFINNINEKVAETESLKEQRTLKVWKSVCRVLLSSSEFIFLN